MPGCGAVRQSLRSLSVRRSSVAVAIFSLISFSIGLFRTYPLPGPENAVMIELMAAPEELSFDDVQILRLESATIKGHTGKVLLAGPDASGGALDAAELRERVAERIGGLPRLRQRVDDPHSAEPAWVDAEPDLEWHVADAPVDGPLDEGALRSLAGELLAERLDHERPLWRIDVAPVEGGGSALIVRIHHAMADGVSAIRLAGALLWDPRPEDETASEPSKPHGKPAPDPPRRHHVGGALKRELRPGAHTALDQHIGPEREVAWTAYPLPRLKSIGKGAGDGVTINDVVLATVAGGLRRWLERTGRGRVRVQIPVSLHSRDESDSEIGNRDSFLNVDLPLDEDDALARLRALNLETMERKQDHDAETLYDFFHAVGRFRPLYEGITRLTSGPREFALSVSNVPGPRWRPSVLGHEITGFVSFAEPADRHALRVSIVSLGGDLAFGLCSDPEAIGSLGHLAAALDESVAELEDACR
jgi:diacylglycerol O-acyltransferase / wax synthase